MREVSGEMARGNGSSTRKDDTQNNNASTRLPSYLSYFEVWPVRARVPSRRAHCV